MIKEIPEKIQLDLPNKNKYLYENDILISDQDKNKPIFDDFELLPDSAYFSDDFQQKLSYKFLKEILLKNEIDIELMGKIMDVLYNNPPFSKILIDNTVIEKKNPILIFRNYHNMQHFANLLNSILINLDNQEIENYELNFAIIYIAERSFYFDEISGNKFYLCAILSKNKLFNSKNFWNDLIETKLFKKLENIISKMNSSNIS